MQKTRLFLILWTAIVISNALYAQQIPQIIWGQNYGGSNFDNPNYLQTTSNGECLITGYSASNDFDVSGNYGNPDIWTFKIDENGNLLWEQNYGGSGSDNTHHLQITSDGNYLMIGNTESNDFDVSGNYGNHDIWIFKIDENGNLLWEQNYGGSGDDFAIYSVPTLDGGFLIIGSSNSNDFDVSGNYGNRDIWIFKIDENGNLLWERNYGGSGDDFAIYSAPTLDGGFLIVGDSESNDFDISGNYGNRDIWIFKIDENGNLLWEQNYGGSGNDFADYSVVTLDGGFLVMGDSESNDFDVSGNYGNRDIWIFKIDENGNLLWEQNYGGSESDFADYAAVIPNNGFLIVGDSESNDFDVSGNYGNRDIWIFQIDENGNLLWEQNYGGSGGDFASYLQLTLDNGYLIAGNSESSDFDVTSNYGNRDAILFKIYVPLGGTYSVGMSDTATFNSLQHAMDSLALVGLYAPVTLELEQGLELNEQVYMSSIPYITAENNVTINGNGATLSYAPTADAPYIIQIDSLDHIIIDNLNIVADAVAECAWGIHLKNQADSIYIRNCTIDVGINNTDTCFIGIVASNSNTSIEAPAHFGNNANRSIIANNIIIGGFMGIAILGNENKTMLGPVIQHNIIEDSYQTGILTSYLTNTRIKSNDIDLKVNRVDAFSNTDNTGIHIKHTISQLEVFEYSVSTVSQLEVFERTAGENNTIQNVMSKGIYIENSGRLSDEFPYLVNNMVSCNFTNANDKNAGLLLENANEWWIYHNSINVQNEGYALYVNAESNEIDLQNNTLTYTSNSTNGYVAQIEAENSIAVWDYNNYFCNNPDVIIQINGIDFNDIASLPDNANSININPIFLGFSDLHIVNISQQTNAANNAIAVLFPLDIDGQARPDSLTELPDMGADEYIPLLILEDTICETLNTIIELNIPDSLQNPQWIVLYDEPSVISYEQNLYPQINEETQKYIGLGDGTNNAFAFSYTIIFPTLDAGTDTSITNGQSITLNPTSNIDFWWLPNEFLDDMYSQNQTVSPTETTTFIVQNNCGLSDSITIFVTEQIDNEILIVPTAFSPNKDGINDIFQITSINLNELHSFEIYNRWGNKVFSTNQINEGWDGTHRNLQQEIGVYQYSIKGIDNNGKDFLEIGTITLIR